MDNNRASNTIPKPWIRKNGRGAFHGCGSHAARRGGVHGKANVGISNDKEGENPSHRKTKVSRAMLIIPGLVGP